MDLALTAGMNEMNRDERDGRLTPPAETGRNGSTGGDPRQPRTNPRPTPGGLLLQGKAEGRPQVRGGHESERGRFSQPTLQWVLCLARLSRPSRLQAIRG